MILNAIAGAAGIWISRRWEKRRTRDSVEQPEVAQTEGAETEDDGESVERLSTDD